MKLKIIIEQKSHLNIIIFISVSQVDICKLGCIYTQERNKLDVSQVCLHHHGSRLQRLFFRSQAPHLASYPNDKWCGTMIAKMVLSKACSFQWYSPNNLVWSTDPIHRPCLLFFQELSLTNSFQCFHVNG